MEDDEIGPIKFEGTGVNIGDWVLAHNPYCYYDLQLNASAQNAYTLKPASIDKLSKGTKENIERDFDKEVNRSANGEN